MRNPKYRVDGEDLLIFEKYFNSESDKICLEVGAAHPEILSTSKIFRDKGWRIISVEPNPEFVKLHKQWGNEIYEYAISNYIRNDVKFEIYTRNNDFLTGFSYSSLGEKLAYKNKPLDMQKHVIDVNVITLNYLLSMIDVQHIDLLLIDTEGWEIEVLQGFDCNKYQPKIIMIENVDHDASKQSFVKSLGYNLVELFAVNEIYNKI